MYISRCVGFFVGIFFFLFVCFRWVFFLFYFFWRVFWFIDNNLRQMQSKRYSFSVEEQRGGRGAGAPGVTFTGAAISSCKCVSTIPIGAPIYIWPWEEVPLAPPLDYRQSHQRLNSDRVETSPVAQSSPGARCSSVVRAFAHGAMGRRINPSWGGSIELFPRLVWYVLSCLWDDAYKRTLASNRKE